MQGSGLAARVCGQTLRQSGFRQLHTLTAYEWQPGLLHRDRICKGFSTGLGTDIYKSCVFFIVHLIFHWSTRVLTSTATGVFQLTHFPQATQEHIQNTPVRTTLSLLSHLISWGLFYSLPSLPLSSEATFHPFALPQLPAPEFQPPGSIGASWGVR